MTFVILHVFSPLPCGFIMASGSPLRLN